MSAVQEVLTCQQAWRILDKFWNRHGDEEGWSAEFRQAMLDERVRLMNHLAALVGERIVWDGYAVVSYEKWEKSPC